MDEVDPLFSWRLESWGNFDHDAFADPENLYDGLLAEMERDQRLRDVDYEELFETVEPHFSPFDDFPPRIPSPCEAFPLPFPTREDPAGLQLNSSGEWRRNRMSDVPFHVPPPTPTERSSKEVPKKHERDTRSCDDDDNNVSYANDIPLAITSQYQPRVSSVSPEPEPVILSAPSSHTPLTATNLSAHDRLSGSDSSDNERLFNVLVDRSPFSSSRAVREPTTIRYHPLTQASTNLASPDRSQTPRGRSTRSTNPPDSFRYSSEPPSNKRRLVFLDSVTRENFDADSPDREGPESTPALAKGYKFNGPKRCRVGNL